MRIEELEEEQQDNISRSDIDIILNIADKINSDIVNSKLLFYNVFIADVISVIEKESQITSFDYIVSRPSIVYSSGYENSLDKIFEKDGVDKLIDYVKLTKSNYFDSRYKLPRLALKSDCNINYIENEEIRNIIEFTVNSLEDVRIEDINKGLDSSIMKSKNKGVKYDQALEIENLSEDHLYEIFSSVKN